jgi:uncharacterized membrane protein YphA (DoxX/SURF4 family)
MIPQLQRNTPVSSLESEPSWSLATRVAFRFFFSYFLLYVYPRSVGSLGAYVKYNNPLRDLWHAVVPWVGANVLHLSGDFTEVANGSGDQLYDWVLLFCIFVTAIVATAIWSWLDRKRPNYEELYQWLRIFVRLSVAVAMVIYGTDKIFRMQFPEPPLARWVDPVAQIPPMSLLWVTVGYSHLYSIFGGLGEMAGAILLLVPRFTTLGALITAGVMSNVLMLNLGYDVPRKIYSIHLIAFCLFLLIPDIRRLFDFFLLNRTTRLTPPVPVFKDRKMNLGLLALQIAIGVGAIINGSYSAHQDAIKNTTYVEAPLRGIWSVEEFDVDGVPRPPLLTDPERWRYVIFDAPKVVTVQSVDDVQRTYYLQLDYPNNRFTFWDTSHTDWAAPLSFDLSQPDRMVLKGKLGKHDFQALLKRVDMSDPNKFWLLNRGTHWVNQYPHIR